MYIFYYWKSLDFDPDISPLCFKYPIVNVFAFALVMACCQTGGTRSIGLTLES